MLFHTSGSPEMDDLYVGKKKKISCRFGRRLLIALVLLSE